jgi:hypothetical protein
MSDVQASKLDSPERWYERAEEAHTMAAKMRDPYTKRAMEIVAAGYHRLGEWAESCASKGRRYAGWAAADPLAGLTVSEGKDILRESRNTGRGVGVSRKMRRA